MKDKELYELGILAQNGDNLAKLEIIERKKNYIHGPCWNGSRF